MPRAKREPINYAFNVPALLVKLLKKHYHKLYHYIAAPDVDFDQFFLRARCEDPKDVAGSQHRHYLYKPCRRERNALQNRNFSRYKGAMPIKAGGHAKKEHRIRIKDMHHLVHTIHYLKCRRSQGRCNHYAHEDGLQWNGFFPVCHSAGHRREDCKEYITQLYVIFDIKPRSRKERGKIRRNIQRRIARNGH